MSQKGKCRQYSQVGYTLLNGTDAPSQDGLIKRLFSNREVLAYLLKKCVREYRKCSRREIEQVYLARGDLKIEGVAVHMGESLPEQVSNASQESKDLLEGTTVFDVVLQLPVPGKKNKAVGVIINIEVQNDDKPGYPLSKRMIYYLCRLVSMQHESQFTKSHYGDLCKVYSLWICPKLKGHGKPTIGRFGIGYRNVYGGDSGREKRENYDLMEGILVRFSKKSDAGKNKLIRCLQLLLTETDTPENRLDELEKKFGITKVREIESMNYEQAIIENAEARGKRRWLKEGEKRGIKKGKDCGIKIGEKRGIKLGEERGIKLGEERGRLQNQLSTLERLEKSGHSEQSIMEALGVSEEKLTELRSMGREVQHGKL